ncbi:MAG TPA: SDR family NAD(P)-dependent oxidoreductase [Bacteroidales bacterium]
MIYVKDNFVKKVVITGAGRGLGKSLTELFLEKGFHVAAIDLHFPGSEIKYPGQFLQVIADVSSETSMKKCALQVEKEFGGVDILISNAGIFDFFPLSESGGDALKRILDVNFFGLSNSVKYFLPYLGKSQGRLVTISSESYKIPAPFQPYAVSKQALEKLYFGIKQELMLKGVSSVLVRPGAIQTNIMDETVNFKPKNPDSLYKEEFKKLIDSVPKYIGKIKHPDDVAKLVFKAATAKNPKRVYKINHNPWVTLLSALPKKLQDWSIRHQLKSNEQ